MREETSRHKPPLGRGGRELRGAKREVSSRTTTGLDPMATVGLPGVNTSVKHRLDWDLCVAVLWLLEASRQS